jgi:methyl-accepting chemotaxis protein
MCLHGVLFTHRLAGPVYRFKNVLREIRSGNLRQEVRIRDYDYFHDLCGEVNSLLDGLRGDFMKFQTVSSELAEKGEKLANSGEMSPEAQSQLLEIANASSMLRRLVDGYQLGDDPEPGEPEKTEVEESDPVYAES